MVIRPVPRRAAALGAPPAGPLPGLTGRTTGRAGQGSSAAPPHTTATAGGPLSDPRTCRAVLR